VRAFRHVEPLRGRRQPFGGRGEGAKAFYKAKIATARFYADHVLVQAPALRDTVLNGGAGAMALAEDQFLAA